MWQSEIVGFGGWLLKIYFQSKPFDKDIYLRSKPHPNKGKSPEAHKLKGVLQNIKKNERESSRLPLAFQKQVL